MIDSSQLAAKIAWQIENVASSINDIKKTLISVVNPGLIEDLSEKGEGQQSLQGVTEKEGVHHCLQVDTESASFQAGFTKPNLQTIDISHARLIVPEKCWDEKAILQQIVEILKQLIDSNPENLEVGILDFLGFINSELIDGKKVYSEYVKSKSQHEICDNFVQALNNMYRLKVYSEYVKSKFQHEICDDFVQALNNMYRLMEKNGYLQAMQAVDVPASLAMLISTIPKAKAKESAAIFTQNYTACATLPINGTAAIITSACADASASASFHPSANASVTNANANLSVNANASASASTNPNGVTTATDIARATSSKPIVHAYEKSHAENDKRAENDKTAHEEAIEKIVAAWWQNARDRWLKPRPNELMGFYLFKNGFESKVVQEWLKKYKLIADNKVENGVFLYLDKAERTSLDIFMETFELMNWWKTVSAHWYQTKGHPAGYYVCSNKYEVMRIMELLQRRGIPFSRAPIINQFMVLSVNHKCSVENYMSGLLANGLSEKLKKK